MEQSKYFQKIIDFYYQCRRLPSYSEIMKLTGLRSKNAVHKLIKKMIEFSFVEKDKSGKIIPGPALGTISLLGTVEAGFPSPAEEELVDTISLDEYLISNKQATYMLKTTGDSMIEAGILPGDLVLVERGRQPKNGDIVIAEVDREWTMKFFRKKAEKIYLEAGNSKYKPIQPEEELKIAAVVTAVIRRY